MKIKKIQEDINALKKHESKNNNNNIKNCRYCGYDHKKNMCPAYGKECMNCKKQNHFAKVCRKPKTTEVRQLEETRLEDQENIYEND